MRLPIRPCARLARTVATAATLTVVIAVTALVCALPASAAAPTPLPTCAAAPGTDDFPLRTRIHGGPARYEAGGGFHTWSLDLTNTTAHTCRAIHPVIVLTDDRHALRADQPHLEFYEGPEGTRPHPVPLIRTDADELVGVLDHDGFPGFTVAPGRTLTVELRLALTSAARTPNDVVANAAVVQRRGDDGDWVGASNDYRFRVVDTDGAGGDTETGGEAEATAPGADELADTGTTPAAYGLTALLLTAGTLLVAVSRRRNRRKPHRSSRTSHDQPLLFWVTRN